MSMFVRKGRDVVIRRMMAEDVEDVREVGQLAWSDLAMHDVGRRFKYPKRSEKIIAAYLWKDPLGCIVAEEKGKIIGSAVCHVCGKVGWTGPLEVLPSYQDHGIGRRLLNACEARMIERGCAVIGLETLSHLPKNMHFYLSSGYRPDKTVLIMEKVLGHEDESVEHVHELTMASLDLGLKKISQLSQLVHPHLDHSLDAEAILRKELGHVYLLEDGDRTLGCALLHTYQRGEESAYSSVKAVLIDPAAPDPSTVLNHLLARCEMGSLEEGKEKTITRFAVGDPQLYQCLLSRTYLLKGVNLRLIKKGDYNERGKWSITSWAG
jgi:GNAT superfamily N-acetyltransferase